MLPKCSRLYYYSSTLSSSHSKATYRIKYYLNHPLQPDPRILLQSLVKNFIISHPTLGLFLAQLRDVRPIPVQRGIHKSVPHVHDNAGPPALAAASRPIRATDTNGWVMLQFPIVYVVIWWSRKKSPNYRRSWTFTSIFPIKFISNQYWRILMIIRIQFYFQLEA